MAVGESFGVEALFANYHSELWVSYTLKSILEGLAGPQVQIGATVMAKAGWVRERYVHPVMHQFIYKLLIQHCRNPFEVVGRLALKRLRPGDAAYFWGGNPVELSDRFRDRDVMIVREMINCTLARRRAELRKAYGQLGMPDGSGISDEMIEAERQELLRCDAVFCPNRFVVESVVAAGVPADRCIPTSYGWGRDRMTGDSRAVADDGRFTACFVGTVDVRKGAPVLLDAWTRSGVDGRLLLAGEISPEIQQRYAHVLARPDVVCLGWVEDVSAVYRSADVFCFPSWEEGGPLVVFEAMAAGVVPIVSPMGSGGAFSASEGIGVEVPAGDVDAFAGAIVSLASDRQKLAEMKRQAQRRAHEFTWGLVGMRRRRALVRLRRQWRGASSSP